LPGRDKAEVSEDFFAAQIETHLVPETNGTVKNTNTREKQLDLAQSHENKLKHRL